ncbi:PEP-CTERM sorting domain-containing protein [Sphingosinicella soli]|uniref:Ice-binding protein C-terminal domain-containing protein n=1 Tax=Sphingosinicella soli TaxID=333708 RepID=A0A7W7FA17_9SPHN|nr:PEP-CTERM sorting domain-containing protein [Sphingosinicella soli]MBB4633233.1 hypothetical protein [Sphingosinicella soli]
MNIAAAGKLALCICTGAVVGAGVNEARHNADKPKISKTASKSPARKVVQFPCEPYIVQDQMMRDAQIPSDFEATNLPEYAELVLPGGGGSGGGGDDGDDGGDDGDGGGGITPVPEPAMLALFGLGAAGVFAGRRYLLRRKI